MTNIDPNIYWRYLNAMPRNPKQNALAAGVRGYEDSQRARLNNMKIDAYKHQMEEEERKKEAMANAEYILANAGGDRDMINRAAEYDPAYVNSMVSGQQTRAMNAMNIDNARQANNRNAMARSIMQPNFVVPDPSYEGRMRQAAEYDPTYTQSVMKVHEGLKPEKIEYDIIDGQYVPKRPGGKAMPVPGLKEKSEKTQYQLKVGSNGNIWQIPTTPGAEPVDTGVRAPAQKGQRIEIGENGQVIIADNVDPNAELTKPNKTGVQKNVFDANESLSELNQIVTNFDPKYQQIGTKAQMAWNAGKDKFGLLDKEGKQALRDYTKYRASAFYSLNNYIKKITGAALSVAEAKRIMQAMPNPGDGMFNGDSPEQFKAKLDNAVKQTKMALARANYTRKNGMTDFKEIPLDQMPDIINQRAAEIEKKLAGSVPEEQLEIQVINTLQQEFGLVY